MIIFTEQDIMNDTEGVLQVIVMGLCVATFLLNTDRVLKAIEICKECLNFLHTKALGTEEQLGKNVYGEIYNAMFRAYSGIHDYTNAIKYGNELLLIYRECGDTTEEGKLAIALASIYIHTAVTAVQERRSEARELFEKAINILEETGDKKRQADAYAQIGNVSHRLGEYVKAKEYLEKALSIKIEIRDREGEATTYGTLGCLFRCLGEHGKAKEYHEKALAMRFQMGDRAGEALDYGNLGAVFHSLGENDKAIEYHEKALAIKIELRDREGEATCYGNLGAVFKSLGEYDKAKDYHEKALAISIETGDKAGEAIDYGNLGTVFQSFREYDKAKEYHEKALAIKLQIGNRAEVATEYGNLGTLFRSLGEYDKAKEFYEKALAMKIETGDRVGVATSYGNLGTLFHYLGEYNEAKKYFEKALVMRVEIGDRAGEAADNGNLGTVFCCLGKYDKAKEHHEKALGIVIEIGDREGEGHCYRNLGILTKHLGEYEKAKELYNKSLSIAVAIGDRGAEAVNYGYLGTLFHSLGEHVMAEGYLEKALSISQDIGDADCEFRCFCGLALVKLSQDETQKARDYLVHSINKSEVLRGFLRDNDQFKIAHSDGHVFPYQDLSQFFCFHGNVNNALYVLELARARALADLMANQYTVEIQISANPQSWIGIENVMKKESNCACLYISYYEKTVFMWILEKSGSIHFREKKVDENITAAGLVCSLSNRLSKSFRNLGILSQKDCEDRSFNGSEREPKLSLENDDDDIQDPEPSLLLLYKTIISPVANLLEEPEIIIVPDRSLYQVPFAALTDEGGKYLSETFRIRIVPSLTTLKLIQDSPADYHSQTGALIVGDPVVGRVRYKGCRKTFNPLPCARKEAEMIGELLSVQPLLGQYATKQAVLERLPSVSLIHFAAHGDAETGEIALSPLRPTRKFPKEEDYLLAMSDISQVRLRAKLVVLSCCHSGRGQIRAEGVVGIARAFLGSGARSVLVALWAIQDSATEQFMRRFYEHLVRGESASESLHETMKWMRGNGFNKVSEWAPFMLIGDNVTFDFGKK